MGFIALTVYSTKHLRVALINKHFDISTNKVRIFPNGGESYGSEANGGEAEGRGVSKFLNSMICSFQAPN